VVGVGRGRFSAFLASTSVSALLIGGGAPAAFAQCAITPTTNQPSVSNSAAQNCINITGITVTGNVTNTATGTLTATGGNRPTRTGITIVNNASVAGAVINAGHITTPMSGTGIFLKNSPSVSGGITNSGTMSVGNGIVMTTVAQFGNASFGGGIVNSGTIVAASAGISIGLSSHLAQTFYGGISNSGTISAGGSGFNINTVSMFSGGITNSGILSAASGDAINLANISMFSGGIGNGGTISAALSAISVSNITTFSGGISNSGKISTTGGNGILFGGNANIGGSSQTIVVTVSTFSGGISNSGTISVAGAGILAGGIARIGNASNDTVSVTISTFSGGISNSGTITAGGNGILAGGNASIGDGSSNFTELGTASVTISTFTGGIGNSGTISAGGAGIWAGGNASIGGGNNNVAELDTASVTISTFAGGISNSGTISAGGAGIWAGGNASIDGTNAADQDTASVTISTFTGGIGNSGTITASGTGIWVGGNASFFGFSISPNAVQVTISTFGGGISNSGTISAGGNGIWVGGNASNGGRDIRNTGSVTISTFSGGIHNSGTISAGGAGIMVGGDASGLVIGISNAASVTISTFSGGISNSGTISAGGKGIFIGGAATGTNASVTIVTFSGGITNSGAIRAQTGIVVGSAVQTFLGAIVNSGTITGSGGTAIDVSGANNAITIDQTGGLISGAIKLSANADQLNISGGAIAGNIVGAGSSDTINFNLGSGNIFTYSNTITGVNNLNFNSGTVVLDGTIANGGGGTAALTIARGGTLLIGSNAASIAPDITDNGAFGFAQSGAFTFRKIISGTGLVEQLGPGTTTLTATNLYSGGTVISGGTLTFSGSGRLGAASGTTTINAGGTLDLGGTTQTQAAVNLAGGTLQNGNLNAPIASTGGTVNGLGGSASLTTTAGVTFVLGTNTYTGPTTVNGGVLNVIGSITNPTVNAGGVLTGTGMVGATQVNSGGILRPGNGTAGTSLTISGNLAFQSGALYLVQVTPNAAAGISVTGTASLGGSVMAVLSSGSYAKRQYDILRSAGLNGTTFAGVTTNLPGLSANLSYSATDVFLNLIASVGSGAALNVNQQNVATSINTFFNSGGALPPALQTLFGLTGANLSNALMQIDGEAATGAERGAFDLMNQFLGLMLDPFVNGRGNAPGTGGPSGGASGFAPEQQASLPPDVALAYAQVFKAPPKANFDERWSAWGTAYGGSNTAQGNAAVGSSTVNAATYGVAAGMDYRVSPSTVVGFALAGAGTNWGLANALGTGRSDALQVGGYGITRSGPAYLAGALAFTNNWFNTNRAALGDQLTANFSGQSYGVRVEGGYRVPVWHTLGVTPYAAVLAQDFSTPRYSETDKTGGGFGLSYAAMNATDIRTELGARFDDPTLLYGKPLILFGRLAWAHDFVSNPALNAAFEALPGSSFTVNGAPLPHDSVIASAGAQYFLKANLSVIGKFDGNFASGYQTYAGAGTLRYTW
jgi:uncharacterized protein with beta-barrel porin domain